MNRLTIILPALLLSAAAQAATSSTGPVLLAQNLPGNNNPYNSPIHRANPNSMQGTQPNVPRIHDNPTVPVPRPPTLENGGIGNGYPRSGQPPGSPRPTIESPVPSRNPNGNR
ncbi:hypothetical protein [Pseudomonas citri]|uniref:hypothetical protein n=1 Tax=Pseudomonas citri TaxID=2978349 RepID=UPI0021B4E96E|nr:hypothetical protein [Pseudomonas citri]